jgi:hypothetical protein
VALHPSTRTLLVVEVKTAIGDLQETLGRLDVKTRLSRQLAAQVAWPEPSAAVPVLLVQGGRTARRVVAEHRALFTRFALRGRAA